MSLSFAEEYPPTYYGPSWFRTEDGKFVVPEHTLGWEIAGWCSGYILDPNCTLENPIPWHFTNEQFRLLLWWYAIDGEGRFINRSGVIQRLKGWGKDPFLAVISLVEFVGPCRFDGWDANGNPKAKQHPTAWVQVCAVSKAQTRNTFELFPRLMSLQLIAEYDITPGFELIRAQNGRRRIEAVTSSYRTIEGGRTTFTLLNEIQHFVPGNNGKKMFETVRSNASKSGARWMAITNAYLPGEDSVGEELRLDFLNIMEGRSVDTGFMYDSIEAHPKSPLTAEAIPEVLNLVRGDSIWIDWRNVIGEIMSMSATPARSRRMWYNQVKADEDALYEEDDWDSLRTEVIPLQPGDDIVLGFDGGQSDDATALVAIRVRDSYVQPIFIFERPPETGREEDETGQQHRKWSVNRELVDSMIHETFRIYTVVGMYADRALWDAYLAQWGALYGHKLLVKSKSGDGNPIVWDMRGESYRITKAHELLLDSIRKQHLMHGFEGKDATKKALRRHVLNTRRRENRYGVMFGKESNDSPLKVDAYAALMLANECLNDYRQRNAPKEETGGNTWFF